MYLYGIEMLDVAPPHVSLAVLIVPLWNWNVEASSTSKCKKKVLIVPLWNWNRYLDIILKAETRSNCTFMELKLRRCCLPWSWCLVLIVPLWNWNRVLLYQWCVGKSSNCTFMELKLLSTRQNSGKIIGSNCTFMELKLTKKLEQLSTLSSSNCTFMELKLRTKETTNKRTSTF